MRFLAAVGLLLAADLLVTLLFPIHEAGAGSAARLDLTALVRASDLIVEGRVLATETIESDGLLLTESLIEVARTFRGEELPYRSVRLPGGVRADGSGMLVAGVPTLVPGTETLLFLGPEGRGGMRLPTGLAQGALELRRDAAGRKRLVGDARALALLEGSGAVTHDSAPRTLDYADLVAAVEAAVQAAAVTEAGR